MTPTEETHLGLLIFVSFWAFASTSVLGTIGSEWRWRWVAWSRATSFVASSLVAAYCLWRLL